MPSNRFLRLGDQVKLSTRHTWSRDETNPTDARGFVESAPNRGGGSIIVRWALAEGTRTNTYNSSHDDLILLPVTVDADDNETRERFMGYCEELGISLQVSEYGENRVTLTPLHDEQVL